MKTTRLLTILMCFQFFFAGSLMAQDFVHPGILHKESDFARMRQKVAEKAEPWYTTWNNLLASPEASLNWQPRATETVFRGASEENNIGLMYRDVAAAYQHALIYNINGDKAHGDKAVQILNAWSLINKTVHGFADRYLAAGLNGYQFANAAEMMRGYPGFELERFKNYMMNVFFYPLNERFLIGNAWGAPHNDACATNYRANWDICNMNAMIAISILCDYKFGFNQAINYCKSGDGTGNITRLVNFLYPNSPTPGANIWGQWEESGRDQGHAVGGLSLFALFCEIAWNQGVDMYGYDDYRYRKGAEYVARYNILENGAGKYNDLPYTSYSRLYGTICQWYTEPALSGAVRGKYGSLWEGLYNHYGNRLNQRDKIKSIYEILQQQPSTGLPSAAIHPDTYDTPGAGALTFRTDSGSSIVPWLNMDISARSITKLPFYGKSTLQDSTLTITGSGTGIKGISDQFQYAFQKLVDDGAIETQITSSDEVNVLCQSGVMIRENLEQNSANIFLSLSAGQGLVLSSRDSTGMATTNIVTNTSLNTFPYWLRVSRSGDVFTASVSSDRVNWTEVGSKVIKMNRLVYAGLGVSSKNGNIVSKAVFDKSKIYQGNMRPVLRLSTPVSGEIQYVSPANVTIAGTAYDMDGLLDKAEVYVNNNLVYTSKVSPFSYNLSGQTEGNSTVYVKAYDRLGATTVSDTVRFSVNPVTNKLPWYKFDETKVGYFAYDASGNNMTATLTGGATFTTGKVNNSIRLDGINDYVKIPNGTIERLSDFTISAWVKMDSLVAWTRIFDFGSGASVNMFLTTSEGSGKMRFSLSGKNNVTQSVTATGTLPLKSWAFVAVTLGANRLNIYINDKLVGSSLSFTNKPYDLGATTANYIGKSQYTVDPYFKGNIDDFRFYNYAMTAEQVKEAMTITAIDDVKVNPTMFYPNPANVKINFVNAEDSELRIYDAMGKLALLQQISSPNQAIDISNLTPGVYIVKTIDKYSNQQQNRLIVK